MFGPGRYSTIFTVDHDYDSSIWDATTVAYNAATGAERWAATGLGNCGDRALPRAVAVSLNGTKVFVTGSCDNAAVTVAYDPATGAKQWTARYTGPANRGADASAVAVSRDGTKIFVTGYSYRTKNDVDFSTVSYSAATGARRWVTGYTRPGSSFDRALSVAVSPVGRRVFVTGYTSNNSTKRGRMVTVAYQG